MICPDCETPLPAVIKLCQCGWVNQEPQIKKSQQVDQVSEQRMDNMLSRHMDESKELVVIFKKEHGENWESELLARIQTDISQATTTQRRNKRAKGKSFFDTPELEVMNSVFNSMPAPNDKDGLEKYYEGLKEVQKYLPNCIKYDK